MRVRPDEEFDIDGTCAYCGLTYDDLGAFEETLKREIDIRALNAGRERAPDDNGVAALRWALNLFQEAFG